MALNRPENGIGASDIHQQAIEFGKVMLFFQFAAPAM
jgi:hypothetical protein